MGRRDPPDRPDPPSSGGLAQVHSEMRDRGLVHEQDAERRRKRRQQRRRTTDVTIKESTETISKHNNDDDSRSKRRKDREKKKSKSSQSVSFAKEISTTDVAERDDRSKPLKSSLKNSALKIVDSERGETSSSGVQSGSNNSDADSINQKTEKQKRQRSATRSTLDKTKKSDGQPQRKTSSDSEGDQNFSDMLRIKAQQRKQRAAEAKVEESERKLIEFAQRLSARKTKLEELHVRLKQRKEKLKEREDKLKYFEAQITDREAKLKAKSKVVRHHEAHLRHEEGSVELREKSVTDKLHQLEARTKLVEVKEDLSVEINDLARKQLYQSSWSMNHNTKANLKNISKSTESLDNLSDIDSDNLVKSIANIQLSRPETVMTVQKQVGLLL